MCYLVGIHYQLPSILKNNQTVANQSELKPLAEERRQNEVNFSVRIVKNSKNIGQC